MKRAFLLSCAGLTLIAVSAFVVSNWRTQAATAPPVPDYWSPVDVERGFEMTILVDGRSLEEYNARGRSSRKGRRFDMARRPGTLRRSHKPATKKRKKARRAQHAAVVRERTLMTKTGMKGVEGGDPAGLSKAMCLIW